MDINSMTGSENANTSLKNVLLIEDDEYCAYTILKLLSKDFNIVHKFNGSEGIQETGNNMYDLLLLDIGLKDMKGTDVLKEIKNIPGYENTPSIAVTAFAMLGDKDRFLDGGFNYYISKPFSIAEFKKLINTALASHTQE